MTVRPGGGALWPPDTRANDTAAGIPAGGTTGQVLKKNSATNYDAGWQDDATGGGGGGGGGGGVLPDMDLITFWTADGVKATASSSYAALSAEDGWLPGTGGGNGWITNGTSTGWLKIEFPSAVVMKSYAIMPWSADTFPSRSPKTWTLQGSNDDSTYTVLDTQTNVTTWTRYQRKAFTTTNTAAYKFYKLNVTLNGGDTYMGVGGVWLYGQPETTAGSGSSLPVWVANHPDTPPASPTMFSGVNYDLEFNNGETDLGATVGSPTVAAAIVNGTLRVTSNLDAANHFVGVEYPCPGAPFTMTVKFRRKFQLTAYSVAHIGLRAGSSGVGAMTNFIQVHRSTGTWGETDGSVEKWSDQDTWVSAINDNTPLPTIPAWYYRIKYDGTNFEYSWSMDGLDDGFQLFATSSLATQLGGTAPGRCFFGARSLNASVRAVVYVDWVRFT